MTDTIQYYYLRDFKTYQPYACIAINQNDDGTVDRGISICSSEDQFDKKLARSKSRGRLLHAAYKKCNSELINNKNVDNVNKYLAWANTIDQSKKYNLMFKSSYNSVATASEIRMLNKPE